MPGGVAVESRKKDITVSGVASMCMVLVALIGRTS
jgi:hypothetical protein